MAHKASTFISIGAPVGALAVIAGCSGGGSVVRTMSAPASPTAGHPAGPTVPVTVVVNPPRRAAATHRSGTASRRTSGLSPTLKIGITVYDPLVSATAPPESVSATPIPRPGPGTPIPISTSVPLSSTGDIIIVHEYDATTNGGVSAPNGYLLSTYTSATPVPIYQNATNTIAITTLPVATFLTYSPTALSFSENQSVAQPGQSLTITLSDGDNNVLSGPVANPPVLTTTLPGALSGANVPVPMSTVLTVNYSVNGNASGTIDATIPQLPAMAPNFNTTQLTATVNADAYYFLGQSDGNVRVYDGYKLVTGDLTAFQYAQLLSNGTHPDTMLGVQPACGGYLGQVLTGSTSGYLASTVNVIAPGDIVHVNGTFNYAVVSPDTSAFGIDAPNCNAYVDNRDLFSGNTLYRLPLGSSSGQQSFSGFGLNVAGLAINKPASTLFTFNTATGYLNTSSLSGFAASSNVNPTMGTPAAMLVANGHIYTVTSAGYLYGYASIAAAPTQIASLGGAPSAMVASPDGNFVFVLVGSTLSYIDNSAGIPTSVAFQGTPSGGTPTAMVVTADSKTLYLVGGGFLFRSRIANLKTSGFIGQAAPAAIFGIPATTISIAISP